MIVEYNFGSIQESKNCRIAAALVHIATLLSRDHNVLCLQYGELLREVCSFYAKSQSQLSHAKLAVAQLVQYLDSKWAAQRFKEFGFELNQVVAHTDLTIGTHCRPRAN
jgi:hypothetical protein